ncbi:hypothetical protein [Pseudooceanicola atlanticus]|uniref:hypothetical protein n=1 Tax=Pseudooceanicola atlanticus TaxID=1461694 RepID=UPI002354BCEA|nr:hypothetical protein [Pseudooceanicola atlanticus]
MTYAKTPNNHETYHQVIEEAYSAMADPAVGPWKVGLLKLLVAVCNLPGAKARYVAILSNALASLPIENRTWFLETYAVSGAALAQIDNPPAWPDVIGTPEDFPTPDAQDLADYIAAMDRRLTHYCETQAARVIKMGVRVALEYSMKDAEARRFADLTPTEQGNAVPADFPYVAAYATSAGLSLADGMAAVTAQAAPWNALNAAIGGKRQDFQIVAGTAEDAAAVKTAYDTHAAAIKGMVDAALA